MTSSIARASKWTVAAVAAFGLALPAFSQIGPKNFVSPTYRAPAVEAAAPHALTQREVNRLAATAETRADHLKIAAYYNAKANWQNAQAAGYEEAAATLRNGPIVKNLMAPDTAPRYEFVATRLREQAKSNRALAASHDEMATVASLR